MKMKKGLKITLKITLVIVALIVLFFIVLVGRALANQYIFYPRTVQDVIDKYGDMEPEEANLYHYKVKYDGKEISYMGGGSAPTYKGSFAMKNRIIITYTEEMSEEFLNSIAKNYNAEVIEFRLDTTTRTSSTLGIEMKNSYTKRELDTLISDLEKEPNVIGAGWCIDDSQSY